MNSRHVISPFPAADHAHGRCLKSALTRAEVNCAERGVRLTVLRRRVLELVWSSHEPVKAYDLLDRLRAERHGAAPPTVYRALDFLQEQGFVHRIESLNAYVGCGAPGHGSTGQFLICADCGEVAEIDDQEIARFVAGKAAQLGFSTLQQTIEIRGRCSDCSARR
jgi:Fur family zinc uptake transcriptional regulator